MAEIGDSSGVGPMQGGQISGDNIQSEDNQEVPSAGQSGHRTVQQSEQRPEASGNSSGASPNTEIKSREAQHGLTRAQKEERIQGYSVIAHQFGKLNPEQQARVKGNIAALSKDTGFSLQERAHIIAEMQNIVARTSPESADAFKEICNAAMQEVGQVLGVKDKPKFTEKQKNQMAALAMAAGHFNQATDAHKAQLVKELKIFLHDSSYTKVQRNHIIKCMKDNVPPGAKVEFGRLIKQARAELTNEVKETAASSLAAITNKFGKDINGFTAALHTFIKSKLSSKFPKNHDIGRAMLVNIAKNDALVSTMMQSSVSEQVRNAFFNMMISAAVEMKDADDLSLINPVYDRAKEVILGDQDIAKSFINAMAQSKSPGVKRFLDGLIGAAEGSK